MKVSGARALLLAHVGFLTGALMIVMMGWTLHAAISRTAEAGRWVDHTRQVLQTVGDIDDSLAVMEAAQAVYLLVGEHAGRRPAIDALRAAPDRFAALTGDNPAQQARARALREKIEQRIAIAEQNAALRRNEGLEAARRAVASGLAQQASAEIAALTRDAEREELRLLALRRAEEVRQGDAARRALLAAVAIGVAVLLPAYAGFVRQSRRRLMIERRLLDLVENLPVTVYRLRSRADGILRPEFIGGGLERVRGQTPDVLRDDPAALWTVILEDDRSRVVEAVRKAQAAAAPFDCEYRIRGRDGTVRWVRSEARLHRQADGSIVWNGYWADITERIRLQEALRQAKEDADAASRAKSVFLATMSHEIRTPMNGVLGMLELLTLSRLDAEQRRALGVVRESARSLLRIIDDILDFSKIEAGRLELLPEVASVRRVVDRAYQMYCGIASSKGLLIEVDIDPRISPALSFDPLRLGQILNNFLSNALKFTSRGSVLLTVQWLERLDGQETLRFSVADSGIGISQEQQGRLFQPFTQAEQDIDRRYGGTGLGLTICRRLAEMMGGRVELESQIGRGTTLTLTLTLPVADARRLPPPAQDSQADSLAALLAGRRAAPSIEQAQAEGTLVLVVDDHPTNQAVLLQQVQVLGYAAESAGNGEEALAMWQSGRFGLVLTDCNMPRMNGYDLARNIRRLESSQGKRPVPIIACTANALGGEAENCLAAGMDGYLAKPVEIGGLMQLLDRWLPVPGGDGVPPDAPAPRGGSPEALPALDRSLLAAAVAGNAAMEQRVLQIYRRTSDDDAVALRRAVHSGDGASVASLAHRIKGASRTVGAEPLARVCESLERAGKAHDWKAVETQMDAFEAEAKRLNEYLDGL